MSTRHGILRAFARSLVATLCAVVLVGCALSGRPEAAPVATFVLQGTAATVVTPNATTGPVLKIATPDAAPAYASSRMAYIEQPYRVDYFARNEWAEERERTFCERRF